MRLCRIGVGDYRCRSVWELWHVGLSAQFALDPASVCVLFASLVFVAIKFWLMFGGRKRWIGLGVQKEW
jgi:hypothetical protein